MPSRSTWLHLRIPFSYFLMPVFLFAVACSKDLSVSRLLFTFLIIHLFLYPASNGFNSYFDKDEKSIGGLKNPPPVSRELYFTSLVFDLVAIILSLITIGFIFAGMIVIYGLVSKMYSHPSVRLKKFPVVGWLITGAFQGLFTFMMCYTGVSSNGFDSFLDPSIFLAGVLTSIMLWGNYPMTQVYQHDEDKKHGDYTLSRLLGIRGTFIFVQIVFALAAIGFVHFFGKYYSTYFGYVFLAAMLPVVLFFLRWFINVLKDESAANYQNTMRLNFISATCLNAFFLYLAIANH